LLFTGATLRPIAFRESATILPPRTGSLLPVPVTHSSTGSDRRRT
jgi:hypothetical protein